MFLLIGSITLWIMLWFRPEYRFVWLFGVFLALVDFIVRLMTRGIAVPEGRMFELVLAWFFFHLYVIAFVLIVFFVVGCGIVALRKWMRARSSHESARDAELHGVLAEIAVRRDQHNEP